MLAANPNYNPTRRYRPELFDAGGLAPRKGLALQPMQPPQLMAAPPMDSRGQGFGAAVGGLAAAGVGSAWRMRAPELKPQEGGNPLGDLPQGGDSSFLDKLGFGGPSQLKPSGMNPLGALPQSGGRHKFLGLFGGGGTLRAAGDAAIVGDAGPELAVRKRGGKVDVYPVADLMGQGLKANPDYDPTARTFGRDFEGGTLRAAGDSPEPFTGRRTQPQGLAAASDYEPSARSWRAMMQDGGQGLAANPDYAGGVRPRRAADFIPNRPAEFAAAGAPVDAPSGPYVPPANDGYFGEGMPSAAGESTQRERIHDQRSFLRRRIDEIEAAPVSVNTNSRFKGFLKSAGYGALRGIAANPQNPLAGAVGGAVGAGVVGAVDKTTDERMGEGFAADRMRGRLAAMNARESEDLKLQEQRADVRYRNAAAGYAEARPEIEAAKQREREHNRRVSEVFRKLNLWKGRRLDPDKNPRHARLLEEAAELGIEFDADSWNDSKGNVVRFTRTDPEHPEQKEVVERNVVTGQETVLGGGGFQATRNSEGMTAAEVKSDEDRDRGFNALQQQRAVQNELQRAGYGLSRERFDFAKLERDDRLSENTRKEMGAAAKMRREAEQAQMDAQAFKGAGMYKGDDGVERQAKWAAAKWKAAEDKAEALRREYFQTYGYLHEPPGGGELKMTMDEFRQLFPNAPNPMASAPSYGVVITDSTQPGTPHTNNYPPRRGAPRAPQSAAPSPSQPRGRVSRANFDKVRAQNPSLQGKSDAEVESALRAQGIEVY